MVRSVQDSCLLEEEEEEEAEEVKILWKKSFVWWSAATSSVCTARRHVYQTCWMRLSGYAFLEKPVWRPFEGLGPSFRRLDVFLDDNNWLHIVALSSSYLVDYRSHCGFG
jgi:hypothetical protein